MWLSVHEMRLFCETSSVLTLSQSVLSLPRSKEEKKKKKAKAKPSMKILKF